MADLSRCGAIDAKEKNTVDAQGHILVSLWKDYDSAKASDLPQTQLKILEQIMETSKKQNLLWDYCCSAREWYKVIVRRNWKEQETAKERIAQEVKQFDYPVLTLAMERENIVDVDLDGIWFEENVDLRIDELEKSCNKHFYTNDSNLRDNIPDFIIKGISNDYEYLLWAMAFSYGNGYGVSAKAKLLLREYVGENYPAAPYLEYREIIDGKLPDYEDEINRLIDREYGIDDEDEIYAPQAEEGSALTALKEALTSFSKKYSPKAIALFAEQELLNLRKSEIDDALADGKLEYKDTYYKELRQNCADFETRRAAFTGSESEIAASALNVEILIAILDDKFIGLSIKDKLVSIYLVNIAEIDLEFRNAEGKAVHKTQVTNPASSYYLRDTVTYKLPDCDDGDYVLICSSGETKKSVDYNIYTISLAYRNIDTGTGVYLADCRTGKPIPAADLEIISKKRVVKTVKNMSFNGFTDIQKIAEEVTQSSDRLEIRCSYVDENGFTRRSKDVYFRPQRATVTTSSENVAAEIFKDRSAFNPGERVQFKAVLYKSWGGKEFETMQAGERVKAEFMDPDHNVLDSLVMITNEFGSVSGSFNIPKDSKGGVWYISLEYGGKRLTSSYLTVDEFVLPTFEMNFEPIETAYFSGDTVTVRGHLVSYSGRSVSAVRLEYSVRRYGTNVGSGSLRTLADGSFAINFVAEDLGTNTYYNIGVKATDSTGETHEWGKTVQVNPSADLNMTIGNSAGGDADLSENTRWDVDILASPTFTIDFTPIVRGIETDIEVPVTYRIKYAGNTILEGKTGSSQKATVDLNGQPSGLYVIEAEAVYKSESGNEIEMKTSLTVLLTYETDTTITDGVEFFCKKPDNGRIAAQIGVSAGRRWFVVELYNANMSLLRSEILDLGTATDASVKMIDYEFAKSYSDTVLLNIFGFWNGSYREQSFFYERGESQNYDLTLEFATFIDKATPREECRFVLQTEPNVECAVTVFDKSSESVRRNLWQAVSRRTGIDWDINISPYPGNVDYYDYSIRPLMTRSVIRGNGIDMFNYEPVAYMAAEELTARPDAISPGLAAEALVRSQFDNTLAFLPLLHSDSDGKIEFAVKPTDKLSTYYIMVYAHESQMRNKVLRREMMVTMPVQVSVAQPQFLYAGDVYKLRPSVSNMTDGEIQGTLIVDVYGSDGYEGTEPMCSMQAELAIPVSEARSCEFEIAVPHGIGTVSFKISFTTASSDVSLSDAVYVKVPVYEPVQTLTEAHSALLHDGEDKDAVVQKLAESFTGVSSDGAVSSEISLIDMVLEAIPSKVEPESENVLSRSEAYYSRLLATYLAKATGRFIEMRTETSDAELLAQIFDCQNADGGFGWYEGFRSSPIVTAVVAERFAQLRDRNLLPGEKSDEITSSLEKAVAYLDDEMLSTSRPFWYGLLSLGEYLYVRTMFPDVIFAPKSPSRKTETEFNEILAKFKTEIKTYLLPKESTGLEGRILEKARRVAISLSLSGNPDLAAAWDLKSSSNKLAKSAEKDIVSLKEYAVVHTSGGMYYPNAVMPFRGLLESEAYAHSFLCDLMKNYSETCSDNRVAKECGDIAEGIRLWLMVQKETQKWDDDAAFVCAISSVLDGSDAVKNAKIVTLKKLYTKPFEEIKAAGNAMTIGRTFYKYDNAAKDGLKEIHEGDTLNVGDKIVAKYRVWSEENRSFVRLEAPRFATLRPVNQLSGIDGGIARAIPVMGWYSIVPASYREVKADKTTWNFDVLPEEDRVITEEYYVTQAGSFTSPVVSVECLYADYYRANGNYDGGLTVQ